MIGGHERGSPLAGRRQTPSCEGVTKVPPVGSRLRWYVRVRRIAAPTLLLAILNCGNENPLYARPSLYLGTVSPPVKVLDLPLDISPDGWAYIGFKWRGRRDSNPRPPA
jgi:hypothetical protein